MVCVINLQNALSDPTGIYFINGKDEKRKQRKNKTKQNETKQKKIKQKTGKVPVVAFSAIANTID